MELWVVSLPPSLPRPLFLAPDSIPSLLCQGVFATILKPCCLKEESAQKTEAESRGGFALIDVI